MSVPTVAIIDYQAGNLRSVQKALERSGVRAVVTSDAEQVRRADGVVFPGQGASHTSMGQLTERGLVGPIKDFIASGKPFLGVCLGLQLLLQGSDEGPGACLGVLKGRVRRLPKGWKVPHMGWNQVKFHRDQPVFRGLASGSHFYFVHSYFADPEDKSVLAGTTTYGIEFCSAAAWENVAAVQFHPEKSGPLGLRLYDNFAGLLTRAPTAAAG